jgi:hypothetical protein
VPLLTVAEIGLVGIVAWLVLGFAIAGGLWRRWRRTAAREAVWTALLIGILVASMADHYWWTMAPMRTMFAIVLALFAARSIPRAETGSAPAIPALLLSPGSFRIDETPN